MEHIYAAFGEVECDPCAHALSSVVARQRIMLLTLGASTEQRVRFASLVPGFWMTRAPDMAVSSLTA